MIYSIENNYLLVKVSNLGATLVSFIDKKTNTDIVLGFDDERGYMKYSGAHMGASVGRNANRIASGNFNINGINYQLSINDGNNNLHSGASDFAFRSFDVKEIKKDSITFSLFDGDMSGGFPGNLNLEISYKLEDNHLLFSFKGICDKDSIFNITNHAYFNLNGGSSDILNHNLKIFTDKMSLNNDECMATDKIINVRNTSFDFSELNNIGNNFLKKEENFSNGGIDHNYILGDIGDKDVAILNNDKLELKISSDLPCVHIYTGNFMNNILGKNNTTYQKHWAICLECDYYPNGINYENVLKPIIKANQEVSHYIKYTVRGL
ncbi:MAG: galactose mutarotase [Erysipelotrichaceae bacterium]|nr:galactose mutarotase [Erysipelotrichaceae bacterium]